MLHFKGLINFIEDLIQEKLIFEVNLNFNEKKLKSGGRFAILKS